MEATSLPSLILAKHQAKLAAAVAGKIANIDAAAARSAASMIAESAEQLERVATEIARDSGASIDILA